MRGTYNRYDPESQSLKITGKGDKQRMVYLEDGAALAVHDWLSVRGSQPGRLLRSIRKGAKIESKEITAQAIYKVLAKRGAEASISHFSRTT